MYLYWIITGNLSLLIICSAQLRSDLVNSRKKKISSLDAKHTQWEQKKKMKL